MALDPISAAVSRPVTNMGSAQSLSASVQPARSAPMDSGNLTISVRPTGASGIEHPSATEAVGSKVYSRLDRLGVELKTASSGQDSAVAEAREKLMPPSDALKPTEQALSTAKGGNSQSVNMLNKAFDHAVFMATVNQVVSGVSDTARTLIRQT